MSSHDEHENHDDLVEPQGVNAGSATEDQPGTGADVTAGGSPRQAPSPAEEADPPDALLGVPDQAADGPGQELSVGEG